MQTQLPKSKLSSEERLSIAMLLLAFTESYPTSLFDSILDLRYSALTFEQINTFINTSFPQLCQNSKLFIVSCLMDYEIFTPPRPIAGKILFTQQSQIILTKFIENSVSKFYRQQHWITKTKLSLIQIWKLICNKRNLLSKNKVFNFANKAFQFSETPSKSCSLNNSNTNIKKRFFRSKQKEIDFQQFQQYFYRIADPCKSKTFKYIKQNLLKQALNDSTAIKRVLSQNSSLKKFLNCVLYNKSDSQLKENANHQQIITFQSSDYKKLQKLHSPNQCETATSKQIISLHKIHNIMCVQIDKTDQVKQILHSDKKQMPELQVNIQEHIKRELTKISLLRERNKAKLRQYNFETRVI